MGYDTDRDLVPIVIEKHHAGVPYRDVSIWVAYQGDDTNGRICKRISLEAVHEHIDKLKTLGVLHPETPVWEAMT